MDCTVFSWETELASRPVVRGETHRVARLRLGQGLRLIYPIAVDDEFADLVRALDRPDKVQ